MCSIFLVRRQGRIRWQDHQSRSQGWCPRQEEVTPIHFRCRYDWTPRVWKLVPVIFAIIVIVITLSHTLRTLWRIPIIFVIPNHCLVLSSRYVLLSFRCLHSLLIDFDLKRQLTSKLSSLIRHTDIKIQVQFLFRFLFSLLPII